MIGEIIGGFVVCLFLIGTQIFDIWFLLRSLNKTEWISTKERLPDDISKVLFYTTIPSFEIGYYDGVEWCCEGWFERNEVTHWMPLPKPPEDGRKGDAE